jgi:transposase
MLSSERINEIHRLYHAERWSMRKIARHLRLAPKTVKKYLLAPAQAPGSHSRASKLDPFKLTLTELLQQDPSASAVVLLQRLRPLGYEGGVTILRD